MLLTSIYLVLLFAILFIFFIPNTQILLIRKIGLGVSGLVFFLSCFLLSNFRLNEYLFQYLATYEISFNFLNLYVTVGLDGLSVFFFSLSSFLIFLCLLFIWGDKDNKEFILILLVLDLLLLIVFSVLDILLFYVFFEGILIPMYLMIGFWGSRERKIRAVYLFFFYTQLSSILMLIALLYIYSTVGTLNFEYVLCYKFSFNEQYWLWLAFFFSFASKVPVFPFHIWLPEAHVEAPTAGSVLLAGILLKLGVYGFLRFSLPLFPQASIYFSSFLYLLCIFGIVFGSMNAIRQTDLKRIVAYSSVAHMNLVTLGIFSFSVLGIEGAVLQSISHGFVSGAMFLMIGILYTRYHSRLLYYYGGLVHMMPVYSVFFLVFTMANIALPGTSSFVGEFYLLCSLYKLNSFLCFFSSIGVILGGAYSLWLYNRITFGNLKAQNTLLFSDLNYKEVSILLPLLLIVIFMGIYPKIFLDYIHLSCSSLYLITIN
jgi:proton-translocating NADH-quinone oxidoreductase chain M